MSFSYGKTSAASIGAITTVDGNVGSAAPVAGVLNIVGSGGVNTVASGNTVTITAGASVATTYVADSGSAVPALNSLNVIGGTGIVTSGSGSTLTISTTGTTTLTYKGLTSGDSPYTVLTTDDYLSCNVTGGAITIRLPSTPVLGKVYIIKDRLGLAATNNITVTTVGGVTLIDAAATYTVNTAYQSVQIIGGSSAYEIY